MNGTTAVDRDLVDMMTSVFSAHRRADTAPRDSIDFDAALWKVLDELGLARLTGTETNGGSGADWHAVGALLGVAAAAAVSVPVVEHDLLAGWLLEISGQPMKAGLYSAFMVDRSGHGGVAPWARSAETVVALRQIGSSWAVAEVAADRLHIGSSQNLAGEPRDRVSFDAGAVSWTAVPDGTAEVFVLRGALARMLQVCGAMERVVGLCIDHVTSRAQFGRPLAKFQAVQRLISNLAAEAALARAAVGAAVARVERDGWFDPGAGFMVAVAKCCAGHAASTVVRNAHQVHGAIGTTFEHDLHRYTKPILAWRSEFGHVALWDRLLTEAAVSAGQNAWALITEGKPLPGLLDAISRTHAAF
jgi:acyl-CoA dehydrogenase